METVRDLIEEARENGYRDLADTLDLFNEYSNVLEVSPAEQPIDDELGLYLRTGIIWAIEHGSKDPDGERPQARESLIKSLHDGGQRELADAFDYCWAHRDSVESDDFDPDELPIDGPELFAFTSGIAYGLAREAPGKS